MHEPTRPTTTDRLVPPEPPVRRGWLAIAFTVAIGLPPLIIRILEETGAVDFGLDPLVEALIFGIGIFAAATLLTWAAEVAETEVSATLALVVLALIAVLPEYAVDLYFAWTAPDNPDNAHLAVANMTGANRLLVGLAWPAIFGIHFFTTKRWKMTIERRNSLGILFLGAATLYSFSIPLRGNLSLIDTVVMFSLFAVYLYFSSRQPPEQDRILLGPAAAIGALPRAGRRITILALFGYCAAVIFAAAEPFAEGLVETGEDVGIDEFILVQWVAPLASEAPEFILAGLLALRGRHHSAMTILISSKVNQWTLLIGSLPLAFAISDGSFRALDFDSRQSEEVFLTAGQSMFAVAILVSLSMSRWEAAVLGGLFFTQFAFTDETIRVAYGGLYCGIAALVLLRDIPSMPTFFRSARDTALHPGEGEEGADEHPPPNDST
jgi:cation:H+ antiporter